MVTVPPDNRPRVYSCIPTYGSEHPGAGCSHYVLPTKGKCEIIPGYSISSALCSSFNKSYCIALNMARVGMIDYFLMHHSDIEILQHGWLDDMIEESQRVGAAVLSVVQPIKDLSDETSTATETDDPWRPIKFKLSQLETLPETFCTADVQRVLHSRGNLLINTGLMLVDLRRPEFFEKDNGGKLQIHFRMQDRIIETESGELFSQFRPEDWEYSRMCHAAGLSVWATRKIKCYHYGGFGFRNWRDTNVLVDEAAKPEQKQGAA